MKKKIAIALASFLLIVLICTICSVYFLLTWIAKYSSEVPRPEVPILIDSDSYLCLAIKDRNYSNNISHYDAEFRNHRGVDFLRIDDNVKKCIDNKQTSPSPYTLEELISIQILQRNNQFQENSCWEKLWKIELLSLRISQKYEKNELEEIFTNYINQCMKEEMH